MDGRPSWPWWMIIYRDGLPVRRQSPIQVLTGPSIKQLHWSNIIPHTHYMREHRKRHINSNIGAGRRHTFEPGVARTRWLRERQTTQTSGITGTWQAAGSIQWQNIGNVTHTAHHWQLILQWTSTTSIIIIMLTMSNTLQHGKSWQGRDVSGL